MVICGKESQQEFFEPTVVISIEQCAKIQNCLTREVVEFSVPASVLIVLRISTATVVSFFFFSKFPSHDCSTVSEIKEPNGMLLELGAVSGFQNCFKLFIGLSSEGKCVSVRHSLICNTCNSNHE